MKKSKNQQQNSDSRKKAIVGFVAFLPFLIALEFLWLDSIFRLLSAKSDFQVFLGLLLIAAFLIVNASLVSSTIQFFNKNKNNKK